MYPEHEAHWPGEVHSPEGRPDPASRSHAGGDAATQIVIVIRSDRVTRTWLARSPTLEQVPDHVQIVHPGGPASSSGAASAC